MPLELQEIFDFSSKADLNYSLYALSNMLQDYQKEAFTNSLMESKDLYSVMALGVYNYLTEQEKISNHFSLLEEKSPELVREFIDSAFNKFIINDEQYNQLQKINYINKLAI